MYVTGEAKHNIDELVDNLKQVVRLDTSQDECSNILQILDSVVNVSKTSIGGIMRKLRCTLSWMRVINILYFLFFSNLLSVA